jgi:hypothetical protein
LEATAERRCTAGGDCGVMKIDFNLVARGIVAIIVIAFIARNLVVIFQYGAATLNRVEAMTELPQWTTARVVSQLDALGKAGPKATIISTAENAGIARFEAASLTGRPLLFVAGYMGPYDFKATFNLDDRWASLLGRAAFRAAMKREIEAHNVSYLRFVLFKGRTTDGRPYTDEFLLDPRLQRAVLDPSHSLLLESFNATLFNHWSAPGTYTSEVTLKPYSAIQDLLVYVPSKRAEYNQPRPTMLFRFETDIFDQAKSMAGIGRYLLFHVVNPAKRFRVELNYTSSANADGENAIPLAAVIAERTVRFPVAGHGAARLFSPPVAARIIDGVPFIALDMGRDGRAFPDRRRGIMTLYGIKYPIDYRRLVGFIRDISVVRDAAYRALRAPQALSAFPKGLEDPNLEFSGIYEDGWIADQAVVWLSAPKRNPCVLALRAMVPSEAVERPLRVSLAVDGRTVASILPAPGDLDLEAAVAGDGRRHEIRITATPTFHLPGEDGRPASIHLESVGFK